LREIRECLRNKTKGKRKVDYHESRKIQIHYCARKYKVHWRKFKDYVQTRREYIKKITKQNINPNLHELYVKYA
jgi:DNA repair ATPase RecN